MPRLALAQSALPVFRSGYVMVTSRDGSVDWTTASCSGLDRSGPDKAALRSRSSRAHTPQAACVSRPIDPIPKCTCLGASESKGVRGGRPRTITAWALWLLARVGGVPRCRRGFGSRSDLPARRRRVLRSPPNGRPIFALIAEGRFGRDLESIELGGCSRGRQRPSWVVLKAASIRLDSIHLFFSSFALASAWPAALLCFGHRSHRSTRAAPQHFTTRARALAVQHFGEAAC